MGAHLIDAPPPRSRRGSAEHRVETAPSRTSDGPLRGKPGGPISRLAILRRVQGTAALGALSAVPHPVSHDGNRHPPARSQFTER